jgi:uncharacterized OB-fold protein
MQKAIAPEISTWPAEDFQLIGSQCQRCGDTTFPVQSICAKCSSQEMSDVLLPRRGTIVAWTTQSFRPAEPYLGRESASDFVPFGVGLVQLGDVVRVEGRLTISDPEEIASGMEVELTMVPFTTDDDGNDILTYAFQPV